MPLPEKPKFIGKRSAACSMRAMFHGPGVQVVALVPVAGPVPPPIMVVTPDIERLFDLLRADEMDVARRCRPPSTMQPFAGDDLGARADDDVDAGLMSGFPALPMRGDAPVLDADVAFDDAPVSRGSARW